MRAIDSRKAIPVSPLNAATARFVAAMTSAAVARRAGSIDTPRRAAAASITAPIADAFDGSIEVLAMTSARAEKTAAPACATGPSTQLREHMRRLDHDVLHLHQTRVELGRGRIPRQRLTDCLERERIDRRQSESGHQASSRVIER